MSDKKEECCLDCRFWKADRGDSELGQCRLNPPVFHPQIFELEEDEQNSIYIVDRRTFFPVTWWEDWCGKWEAKGESTE